MTTEKEEKAKVEILREYRLFYFDKITRIYI